MQFDDEETERLKLLAAFDKAEIERLRRIADEDEKREWLFALIRKSAAWIMAVLAALVTFRDQIVALLNGGRQ